MSRQLAVRISSMGEPVFLLRRHLREGLLGPAWLEPGVPSEMLIPARLDQNLACALAKKDFPVAAVPVRDTALRSGGAIVERIRDRGESFAARGFEEPADVRSREVAQLVEAQG